MSSRLRLPRLCARTVVRSWLLKAAADCFLLRLCSAHRSRHALHAHSICRCSDMISVVVPTSFVLFVCNLNGRAFVAPCMVVPSWTGLPHAATARATCFCFHVLATSIDIGASRSCHAGLLLCCRKSFSLLPCASCRHCTALLRTRVPPAPRPSVCVVFLSRSMDHLLFGPLPHSSARCQPAFPSYLHKCWRVKKHVTTMSATSTVCYTRAPRGCCESFRRIGARALLFVLYFVRACMLARAHLRL